MDGATGDVLAARAINPDTFRANWRHVLDPTEHGGQINGYNVPVYTSGTIESGGNHPIQRAYPREMVRSRTQNIFKKLLRRSAQNGPAHAHAQRNIACPNMFLNMPAALHCRQGSQ